MQPKQSCHFFVKMALSFVHTEKYTLMDLPVHGEQIEPGPIFIACFSHELLSINYAPEVYIFAVLCGVFAP